MLNEILTNTNWLMPQMDCLLWLQNLRIQTGGIFDNFFLSLTKAGELFIPTIFICIIYWCVDTKAGIYLLMVNNFTNVVSLFLKMSACIYRPWILNNAVHPQEQAIKMAGSYSFPSGHSAMASSAWGGMSFLTRKNSLLCSLLIFFVLLIGFSRLFLGVHTLQDVIVGVLTGVIMIFIFAKFTDWCENDKTRYLYVLLILNVLSIAILYYVLTKSYPMDYINGKLLVNPHKAQYITVTYFGWIVGFLNGALLCRKFFPFEAQEASLSAKIARGIIGSILLFVLYSILENCFFNHNRHYRYSFSYTFFTGFFLTAIYPFIFSRITLPNWLKNMFRPPISHV